MESIYEQRVLLAQDIIAQIKVGELLVCSGAVFGPSTFANLPTNNDKDCAREQLQNKPCDVCAKGAALIAYVRRFNQMTCGEVVKQASDMYNNTVKGNFGKIFTPALLAEMETLYERNAYPWNKRVLGEDNTLALRKFSREQLPEEYGSRLIAIMKLLITNGGRKLVLEEK